MICSHGACVVALVAIQRRIAVGRAHASLTQEEAVTSIDQTFLVPETALVEGSHIVAELPRELHIGRVILELSDVLRACAVVFLSGIVYIGITEKTLSSVALIVNELDCASASGRAI